MFSLADAVALPEALNPEELTSHHAETTWPFQGPRDHPTLVNFLHCIPRTNGCREFYAARTYDSQIAKTPNEVLVALANKSTWIDDPRRIAKI